ncbi:MAG TPA: FGGY family carbohydrate kinase [Chitinophagaceae bacterium]|nr:FGGY family carbohydrate kinase [Chitinophagaceae bacterium]
MLLLGIDIGTSFIKASVVDASGRQSIAAAQYPETETPITSLHPGWAEQSPDMWWQHTVTAIRKLAASGKFNPGDIKAIGISYQMHGLVVIDKNQKVLRDAIIWCDSRAVEIGNKAYEAIGNDICSACLLNSPGNFTASKLKWVKENEPAIYDQIDKIMLPGDFIAMKLTGNITTTPSALSEGIFFDFSRDAISKNVMDYFGFESSFIPVIQPVFSNHGTLLPAVAEELSLNKNVQVTYKAGDQPNNALSLNVLKPGEVAATAGTSGVIYAVTDELFNDKYSRVNAFAHVNHTAKAKRIGVLLCINGTGIMNSWIKKLAGNECSYQQMNDAASHIATGSEGLMVLPFGNGAERMLQNKTIGAHISNIDLNKHTNAHLFRATQEGIAFAFRYGLDIMRENNLYPSVIRAGRANMFLSDVFTESFVNATGVAVELYANDGSTGAALGAGIGAGIFKDYEEAFNKFTAIRKVAPSKTDLFNDLYGKWKEVLESYLKN